MGGFSFTVVDVGARQWLDGQGNASNPNVFGAQEYQQVTVDVGTGSGKKLHTTRLTVNVLGPYSQAGLIQAVKDLVSKLPDKHPDEGLSLGVV